MRLITVHFPEVFIAILDDFVKKGHFPNRSEAIRTAVRDMIKDELSIFDSKQLKKKLKPLKELIKG